MTTTHLHMHVFAGLVFLEAVLFWRNLYNPNRPQLFLPEDGKGPRFVFPPLLCHFSTCVCPCHLPPLCGKKNHSDISNIYKDGLLPLSISLLIQWQDLKEESSCITSCCAPETHYASSVIATSFTTNQLTR
ncbi:hypothetical protein PGIGA_G00128090 [Pangasianodon gigas]|uniref:Uncharacterized protein n=1 Tax=Pangasianodon gigas TaxID=30993 RepID=A0ACC5XI52_PANGG|nr:hypothetical protein [Pangasianodon gigas]